MRLHIGIFGRRNAGKSSLLNALVNQQISIVSPIAGTTTDPVEKPMELLPIGPVLFIDTAGVDDTGELGELRINKTKQVFDRTDLGLIVIDTGIWGDHEDAMARELKKRSIQTIVVFNKSDIINPKPAAIDQINHLNLPFTLVSTINKTGIDELRALLFKTVPDDFINAKPIINDLVLPGELAILVIPVDKEAPKGRIILPQVQTMRNLLDGNAMSLVVQDTELHAALDRLKKPPAIVVTDSQAFETVGKIVPSSIPLTSFSILFARYLGDLDTMVRGAMAINTLKEGDTVLIAESCTHHPVEDDIGTVKIPRWLNKHISGNLVFEYCRGRDFPANLSSFKMVIHCGACMNNRRIMLNRIMHCTQANVPITNYGLAIAWSLNIFDRALKPFPRAYDEYQRHLK